MVEAFGAVGGEHGQLVRFDANSCEPDGKTPHYLYSYLFVMFVCQ